MEKIKMDYQSSKSLKLSSSVLRFHETVIDSILKPNKETENIDHYS